MDFFRVDEQRLEVVDIDVHPRLRTPVAQLNSHENRQAHRGEEEEHISRAILPGDRIRAVKLDRVDGFRGAATLEKAGVGREVVVEGDSCGTMSASKMLTELSNATSFTDPQEINLSLSRDVTNVLKPAEHVSVGTPPKLPQGSTGFSFNSASPAVKRALGLTESKRGRLSRQRRSSSTGLICAGAGAIGRRTF
jgi:hypothetical protein